MHPSHSIKLLVCFALGLWLNGIASAQQTIIPQEGAQARKRIRAQRIDTPPMMDGLVSEPVWQEIEPANGFIQQEPNEGSVATEKTEVRFGYDARNVYIGIICFDSQPENIVVCQNRRDGSLTDTDSIQILLDTFHDRQNAFIFGTSPTGIEYDGQVSKAGQGDSGTFGQGGGQGGGTGQGGAQRGGAAAFNGNWDGVWSVRSQITARGWEAEMVIPFRTLRYIPGADRVWGLQIMRNLRRHNEQSFWTPISRAFDLLQVDVAGELEGLDLQMHRNMQLVPYVLGGLDQDYTRSQDQSKLTRNAGLDVKYGLTPSLTLDATFNTDFAQVEVDEQQVNLTRFDLFFPEKRPFFLENAGIFDFGAARETEIFFSRRIGIDESGVQIPIDAGARLSGHAGRYDDSHHDASLSYREVGPDFNPEVGYLLRANYRRPGFGYRHTFYPEAKHIRSIYPHFQWNRWYTLGTNDLESEYWHNDYGMNWQGGESLSLQFNRSFERLDKPFEVFPGIKIAPGRYGFSQVDLALSTNQSAPRFASGSIIAGNFYSGTIRTLSFSGGIRKGANLTWSGSYTRNIVNLREGDFTTDLAGFRFNWSFTSKSYLQTFTQYNSRINQVGTNVRFALLSTSSNGLFVVYNTRDVTMDYLDPYNQQRTTLTRALLVKYTYLFDF